MTRRGVITIGILVVGLALMAAAYLFGAAPWCADAVECSNPRIEWSPAIFVLGVVLAFSSAIYYEVAKDKKE
jgi:drug/metabolite transporter (DMT)-like permease